MLLCVSKRYFAIFVLTFPIGFPDIIMHVYKDVL